MRKTVKINGYDFDALIDTGSTVTLVRYSVYANLGMPTLNPTKIKLTAFGKVTFFGQMNSLAASVKLTYLASMVDRITDFCLKVRHEIGVPSIKVMNPPIDTRSSLFVAKSESE
ncbi:hypothetical protein TNCV_2682241 [Trichonephila clavipes]|nr:hypothetical protein TNCV_2682241 [Trichonephila clavipes]